jgi:hypothetical protein
VIKITITGELTGKKALLYELPKRQGRRTFVSTYKAFAECLPTKRRLDFAVVRDSSIHVFGGVPDDRYGEGGECPPCAEKPYLGIAREGKKSIGFRIQIYEAGCEEEKTLKGQGTVLRSHMQIHFGAAASHGCIMVAGRRRLYFSVFETWMRAMLLYTNTIEVMVEPR